MGNCLLQSIAYLLEEKEEDLAKELGHDGSIVLWPYVKHPFNQVGYHIQEINDLCLRRGKALVEIEYSPQSAPRGGYEPVRIYSNETERFRSIILNRSGLLITTVHAMAWDGEKVWDPRGEFRRITDVTFAEFWLLVDITSKIDVMFEAMKRNNVHT